MRKNFLPAAMALFASVALVSCGSADDENSITGSFNKGFNENWDKEFVSGCVSEAVKVGAPEADARPICSCMAEELGESLDGISEKMNPPTEKLEAATKKCIPGA